jgi:type II secretory pathway pseudopilin PulG
MPVRRSLSPADGIALVEILVAMLVLIVGLVSMAQLLAVSTAALAGAGAVTGATLDAHDKLEELLASGFSGAALAVSTVDTLAADVPGHFDRTAAGRTRRWRVDEGPGADIRFVRVLVMRPGLGRLGGRVELVSMVRRQ